MGHKERQGREMRGERKGGEGEGRGGEEERRKKG